MPRHCAVYGCTNNAAKQSCRDRSISFHRFPLNDNERLKRWVAQVNREKFTPNQFSFLCSEHFKQEDFTYQPFTNRREVKKDAVPSLFSHKPAAKRKRTTTHQFGMVKDRSMAVHSENTEESEIMEVDIVSMPTEHKQPPLVNGFSATKNHISSHFEVKPGNVSSSLDVQKFLSTCRDSAINSFKAEMDSLMNAINRSIETTSSMVSQTEETAAKLQQFISSKNALFKAPIPRLQNSQTQVKTYKNAVSNNVMYKSALNSAIQKNTPTVEGLEILNTVSIAPRVNLPPVGELVRGPLAIGSKIWAMKTNLLNVWVKGTITNVRVNNNSEKLYKVRLDNQKFMGQKLYNPKSMAYENPASVTVPVGTRIIAKYTDSGGRSAHYAGIVAEPPKVTNLKRYLIFFDDGCAQYVKHEDIYIVCAQSVDVADDCHENMSEFVRGYLLQYPERPMVKLQTNQFVKTEYNSEWSDAKVLEVDCSMVKMLFLTTHRIEWIYRGSTRLKPLRNELANAEAHRLEGKNRRRHNIPRRPHQPYVEYTREDEDIVVLDSDSEEDSSKTSTDELKSSKPRNTARKSLATRPFNSSKPQTSSNKVYRVTDQKSHLGIKEISCMRTFNRIQFRNHDCAIHCREKEDPSKHKGINPLLIPLNVGWERQIRRFRSPGPGPKVAIIYRAPCGRHLRNIQEVLTYLYLVKSRVTIDMFTFNTKVIVFRSFRPLEALYNDNDITRGRENMAVSCINSLSDEPPPYVEYCAKRYPGKGVFLNLDPGFLCGCDCTDNCQNPATCSCQQLTNYARYGTNVGDAGYKFRRLKEPLMTGIYECNSKCRCNSKCGNRVVQNGITVRLQMFKTQYKGWGIRCLDDIDAGQFICIYAGQLLTDQGADEDGKERGDEYLAELDHIEVVEKTKEGYESDVPELAMEIDRIKKKEEPSNGASSDDHYASSDSDVLYADSDSEFESILRSTATSTYATRSRQKDGKKSSNSSMGTLSNAVSEDSSSSHGNEKKENSGLPDLTADMEPIKINPRPLSPESAEVLDKIELTRQPKISDNGHHRVVAKKSASVKNPMGSLKCENQDHKIKFKSVRSYFGEDSCYIMDARSKGNIGRYLNHSCEPNAYVQNVFVDNHDLRFPTIAFFAYDAIDAGTELTWDYNYEVNSVADKVMYCYCEASTCRGRLL